MRFGDLGQAKCLPYGVGKNRGHCIRQHRRPGFSHATEHAACLLLLLSRLVELVELLLGAGKDHEQIDLVQIAEGELANNRVDDVDLRASSLRAALRQPLMPSVGDDLADILEVLAARN